MDKYFTPDIGDITIGYEVESHEWSIDEADRPELNYDRWVTKKLDVAFMITLLTYGVKKGNIRVPYLTKEQIIAEGWFHNHNDFTFGKYTKEGLELWYDYETYSLDIDRVDEKEVHTDLFQGECRDINTFCYICKSIKI